MVWKVCLHTWMTPGLVLQTGKHTSAIWKLFSMLWLPMVWQLIWKSVFLQPHLLKFLATQFRRQERPRNQKLPAPSGHQAAATFSWHDKLLLPFLAKLCPSSQTFDRSPEGGGGGPKVCNGPPPLRRLFRKPSASWRRWCHFNTLPQMLSFPLPLTPPILISEESCSKKPRTIGSH